MRNILALLLCLQGERAKIPDVLQSQSAATVAALLGEGYRRDVPKAAAPIAPLLER